MALALPPVPGLCGATNLAIPQEWSPAWFRSFIANQLKNADTRNAIAGAGISITGNITQPATISNTGVTQIVAGTGITITPPGGTGAVTINASGGAGTTLSAAILADTPFAFWKGDDASTSLADSSGNSHALTTVTGTPTYHSGLLIPSLPSTQFINLSGYTNTLVATGFSLASALGQTLPLTTWTVEFIASQFASTNFARYVDWRTSATTAIFALFNNAGVLSVVLNNTTTALIASGFQPIGSPLHVIITCTTAATTSTLTVYLNGIRVGAAVTATASTASGGTPTVGIGDYTFGGTTSGLTIGYVALYNTALSVTRIGAHAQAAGMLGFSV